MFNTFCMNLIGCIGCFLMIPVMGYMIQMIDSMNTYNATDICDMYLLCERVGELERDMVKLSKKIEVITEQLHIELCKDTVDSLQYNREKQLIKDDIKVLFKQKEQYKEQYKQHQQLRIAQEQQPRRR
jgi:hypothetical protein